ncbi:hypothetical protein SKAU_G00369230 [Synaphobranchus kaupii]|uniref:Uncharacterized protein n=1 Tax=Synaphobranchus kaupii TaxID=118154 RepID=A0A9Q1EFQ6_SYNKA|nr:hypothetical protein SKAU_G00369230 [Synaphobranchus kaupii]
MDHRLISTILALLLSLSQAHPLVICKNPRGLKIHQAKMKCLVRVQLEQCTGSNLGEMQEEPGQESTHSAQNLQVPEVQAPRTSQHQVWVKWPPTSKAKV